MGLVEASTRRPVTVFIFAVAATLFGAIAYRQLPVDLLPDIAYPSLTVRAEYPGAAPAEVESLVTRPIENAVGVVNNVLRVVSSSRSDISEVTLEFAWGTDMDFASLEVRERLDVVRLPVEVEKPILLRFDPSLDPILRVGLTGDSDLIRLRRLAEEVVERGLERVEDVAAAVVSGGLEEEIQVELDETKMTSLGLSVDRLRQRLAQENVNLTGGRLREGQAEYLVRTVNEVLRAEELADIVVERGVAAGGGSAVIRLGDVARVRKGAREREVITRIDGREAVEVAVYKEGGTNTVAVARAVRERLPELEERLRRSDGGARLEVVTDQSRYIQESIASVVDAALFGGLLAVAVLYLFLRNLRATLTIAVAIPISIAATFFLMFGFGVSLNIMSLGGLTLGVGLLVDNSIVVLESIARRREEGLRGLEAARAGASEVSRAVTASTLTTICVFVPIVFVEGVAGQLFGDQALTVTFSLLVSLLVALSTVPMLASRRFGPPADRPDERPDGTAPDEGRAEDRWRSRAPWRWLVPPLRAASVGGLRSGLAAGRMASRAAGAVLGPVLRGFDGGLEATRRGYRRLLERVTLSPWPLLVATVAALGAAVLWLPRLGSELVPELVQGELFVNAELRPGTRLEVTERRLAMLERELRGRSDVATVYTVVGASNEQGGTAGQTRENIGQITVRLEPPPSRGREEALMADLRSAIDRQNASFTRPEQRIEVRFARPSYFSFRTPVEVEVRGYNLEVLQRLAARIVEGMRGIEGLADVESSTEGGSPELRIVFDRERLASLGLTIGELGERIRAKIQGVVATDTHRQDRNIDIRVRSAERFRDSVRDLRSLNVAQTGSVAIRLDAVARVVETEGPAEIRRVDGTRVAVIRANLDGTDLATAAEEIEGLLNDLELPPGFETAVAGQREEMEASFRSMRLAIGLAIFMVYLVMASQFESLVQPFVILFSVPFSLIGVVLALAVTQTALSVVVLIGAILLAGIVVNNAIVLVDYANQLRTEGVARLEAVRRSAETRLRPILMTTATTALGLLPMALGLGEGSELRAPMAITVIGGLLTSTFLTLLVLPSLYLVLDRRPQRRPRDA